VSDAASGHLLTARGPTSYRSGEPRPDHYLDSFHGALHVSPDGARIFDDGWFWQPVGNPEAGELAAWLDSNAWESEDGHTKIEFCFLEYWDRAVTWIGNNRVAIEDIGDDDTPACTRVFDLTKTRPSGRDRARQAAEVAVLYGPEGRFFSDGTTLSGAATAPTWHTTILPGDLRRSGRRGRTSRSVS
jgi:hypothetical protein